MRAVLLVALLVVLAGSVAQSPSYANTQNEYVSCMDETDDQEGCLQRLGRHSWQPKEASCFRTQIALQLAYEHGLKLSWRFLFFNERCARSGLPHFVAPSVEVGPAS